MRMLALSALLVTLPTAVAQDKFGPITPADLKRTEPVIYQTEIEPIFEEKCMYCHSGKLTEGKFDMGSYASLMKGGESGKAVVPKESAESLLFQLCSRSKKPIMPPKSEEAMTPDEVALVKLWIDQGANPPTGIREKAKVVVGLPPALVRPVRSVSVSPDGSVVAASHGNQIHLFDVKTGAEKLAFKDASLKTPDGKLAEASHLALVDSLAVSPDGKVLASGSFREGKLWDVATGKLTATIGGFADRVVSLDFAPDGKTIATGGGAPTENGEVKLVGLDGKVIKEFADSHSDTVFGVEFSHDGKLLASCAADKFVKVFEVPSGKFLKSFEGHTHHVLDVGWTEDDKKLASAGADNVVKIWDYEKGEQIRTVNAHSKQVTRLVFVGKTRMFLTVSGDKQLKLWDANNGRNSRNFGGNDDFLYAVSTSDDGKVIAAGGEEGVIRVYDQNAKVLHTIDPDKPAEEVKK